MPTARQHFEQFPEPYRSQAIENTKQSALYEEHISPDKALNKEYETAEDAVGYSFLWDSTPQGYQYWEDFYTTLC